MKVVIKFMKENGKIKKICKYIKNIFTEVKKSL